MSEKCCIVLTEQPDGRLDPCENTVVWTTKYGYVSYCKEHLEANRENARKDARSTGQHSLTNDRVPRP